MKITKKLYSFILILAMLVSVFSVSVAFAAEPEVTGDGSVVTLPETEVPYAAAATSTTGKIVKCKTTAPVMKTASAKGASAGKLKLGAKVTIKKANSSKGWHQIVFGKGTAYIETKYVELAKPNNSSAPAVKEPVATKTYASTKKVAGVPAQIDDSTKNKGYVNAKWSYDGSDTLKFVVKKDSKGDTLPFTGSGLAQQYSLKYGNGKYNVWIVKVLGGNTAAPETGKEVDAKITGNDPFLASVTGIEFNSNMAPVKLAAQLAQGKKTDLDKVTAIYNWVVANVKYDYNVLKKGLPDGYQPNIEITYATKKGVCTDFSSLFAAMCRSQGIPCKKVIGNTKDVPGPGIHAWNEVLVSGSWKCVDTSTASIAKAQGAKYNMFQPASNMKKTEQQ